MKTILENNKVCAIMRNVPLDNTLDYAGAVYDGGIRMFEIAMNSPEAVRQIEMVRKHFDKKVYVGAGTVMGTERCKMAEAAGAQFFLTPAVSVETMEYAGNHNIPLLPGVLTPTDVGICLEYGYSIMKLFPAGDMPPHYIKSLKGPFDGTEYVAVGGVTPDNCKSFFDRGFIGVGIGSNLISKEYLEHKQWEKAREQIQRMMQSIGQN